MVRPTPRRRADRAAHAALVRSGVSNSGGAGVGIVTIGLMLLGVYAGADQTLGQRPAMGVFGLLAGARIVAAIGLHDLLPEAVRHRILRRRGAGSEQSK